MMARPFKTGDRVRYVSGHWGDTNNNPLWGGAYGHIVGTVDRINGPYNDSSWIGVMWDNGSHNSYSSQHDLQHHSNIMEGEEL